MIVALGRSCAVNLTPKQEAHVKALRDASEQRERARITYDEACATSRALLVGGLEAKIRVGLLAKAAKISRQRVYQIMEKEKVPA